MSAPAGFSGSYAPSDVTFLLTPLDLPTVPIAEKERQMRSGQRHYSELLSTEAAPSAAYLAAYHSALASNGARLAGDIAALAAALAKRACGPRGLALASFARAGTPIGVLLARALARLGAAPAHYSISIIRDRGIDPAALDHIAARHDPADIVFVDGWTGKGAIAKELRGAAQFASNRTLAGPAIDENDVGGIVARGDMIQRGRIDPAIADDADRIVHRRRAQPRQRAGQQHPDRRPGARERGQRQPARAARPLRQRRRQRSNIACQPRAIAGQRAVISRQISRAGRGLGAEQFGIVPLAAAHLALFFGDRNCFQVERGQQKGDVARRIAARKPGLRRGHASGSNPRQIAADSWVCAGTTAKSHSCMNGASVTLSPIPSTGSPGC